MRQYLIGIDIGTSGCKSILTDERGHIEAEAFYGYDLSIPQTGWCEQDPEDWWMAVKVTLKKILEGFKQVRDIVGIGLSGQMHGLVLLDKNSAVLRPCIIWADQRTEKQCREIYDRVGGPDELLKLTNNKMLTGYTGGKLLWVRENEPAIYEKIKMVLNPKDYIRFMMTGEYATEVSDASGTGFLNVKKREWSYELLNKLNIPIELLPACYESTEVSGNLSKSISDEFGLPAGLPVVGGGGDAIIQSVGSGLVRSGILSATIGTGGQICALLDRYYDNADGKLQLFCNVIPGKWHAMGVMLTAGGAMKWLKDLLLDKGFLFGGDASETLPKGNIYELLDEEASSVEPGSKGLIFLPYLNGERCPYNDPEARGSFVGLNLQHRRPHLVRSVLEGVVFGLRDISQIIKGFGYTPEQVFLSGGGANSNLWRQITADILNTEVLTMKAAAYGGAFGAALIAGTGVGVWSTVEEAAKVLEVGTRNSPIQKNAEKYNQLFPIYHDLYGALSKEFRKLARLRF